MKKVTKEQFDAFIKDYLQVKTSISGISEPPMKFYDDFSAGEIWPKSTVAKVRLWYDRPHEYFVREI